jgi:ABC-2 type transport system permease protein
MLASRTAVAAVPSVGPFLAYLRLEIRRSLRNRRYLVFTIVFPVLLYVMYTAIVPTGEDPGATLDGLTWPVYFLVSMAAYGAIGAAMSQAVPVATERRQGWARQLRVTPLPGLGYVGAKVASAVLLTVPALVLVGAAGMLVNHVDLPVGRWIATVAALAIGSIPFAALGLLIGYVLDVESAQGGMVLSYFALAIFGGLFTPLPMLPEGIATIGRVLPSSHFASLGRSVVAGRLPDPVDVLVLAAWAVALGALAAWRYVADERSGRA